jgi:hypothetical protein
MERKAAYLGGKEESRIAEMIRATMQKEVDENT